MSGGRDGAREALARFWHAVAESSPFPSTSNDSSGDPPKMPAALKLMLQWTDYLSPEQLNPLDINPLRDILVEQIDFERLHSANPIRLFIAATHANSGKVRIFRNPELSVDAILASACLPTIHHTIEIAGEPYWDGGYSANPAVFPLFFECDSADTLLVLLTPLRYAETPASAQDIKGRLRELAFNATFLREMRMFAHLRAQVGSSLFPLGRMERRLNRARFHAISAESLMSELHAESKLTVNLPFFKRLFDNGQAHAEAWLSEHHGAIGQQSTVDLEGLFY
jgi:NTE family protein